MPKATFRALLLATSLSLSSLLSCDAADRAFDCQSVCNRFQDCFASSYDAQACQMRCRERAASDPDYERQADVCEACIGDRSCSAAAVNCAAQCLNILR
jgi:hypothetical protein